MIVCWSVKGGSGTSVVAALLALAFRRLDEAVVLVDAAGGDQAGIFGVEEPPVGFRQWAITGDDVPPDAVGRLLVDVTSGLKLLAAGRRSGNEPVVTPPLADRTILAFKDATPVIDAGVIAHAAAPGAPFVDVASTSLLVIRPCYLAARRAAGSGLKADGLVVVEEVGRALDGADIADVIGAPVVATVPWDPAVARAVDAGRLGIRLPRAARELEHLATRLIDTSEHRRAS